MKSGYFNSYKTKACFKDLIYNDKFVYQVWYDFGSYLKHKMVRIEKKIMKTGVMERGRRREEVGEIVCEKVKMLLILF